MGIHHLQNSFHRCDSWSGIQGLGHPDWLAAPCLQGPPRLLRRLLRIAALIALFHTYVRGVRCEDGSRMAQRAWHSQSCSASCGRLDRCSVVGADRLCSVCLIQVSTSAHESSDFYCDRMTCFESGCLPLAILSSANTTISDVIVPLDTMPANAHFSKVRTVFAPMLRSCLLLVNVSEPADVPCRLSASQTTHLSPA